jgi:hypothetical protein
MIFIHRPEEGLDERMKRDFQLTDKRIHLVGSTADNHSNEDE